MNKKRVIREQSERGSEVLFEDDKLIVAKILTQEAACYYAQNSAWCKENYFSKYNRLGDVYYFISKNPKSFLKYAMFVDKQNNICEIHNLSNGEEYSVKVLTLQFPSAKEIIGELYLFNITNNLEDYILEIIDIDTLIELNGSIDSVYTNKQGRGDDELVIENDDTHKLFEKLMNLDYDDIMVLNKSIYGGDWIDYDSAYEEISSGWGIYNAYDYNTKNKLSEIAQYLIPDEDFDFENASNLEYLMNIINDEFWSELGDITHEYQQRLNSAVLKKIKEEAEDKLNEYLDRLGFEAGPHYDNLSTTTYNLLNWCRRYNYVGTLDTLIQTIFERNNHNIPGFYDMANETTIVGDDKEEYIKILNHNLDKILLELKDK